MRVKQWIVNLTILCLLIVSGCSGVGMSGVQSDGSIAFLNVSYDATRSFYVDFNQYFERKWQEETGQKLKVKQSHGGSGKQTRSVLEGLDADVVTLALGYDIDVLQLNGLVAKDWQSRLASQSTPYFSTIVFLVRKGNPKSINDWDDLIRDGIGVITPNPKSSGGARWNFLAALGYANRAYNKDSIRVREYMQKLINNVPVLDAGARAATGTFVEREFGDVLLSWENEALQAKKQYGDRFDVVYPSVSILAQPSVSLVDKNADKHGTRAVVEAYLNEMYTDEGQQLIAKHFFRPSNPIILEEHRAKFPEIDMLDVERDFGGWLKAQKENFNDGGLFDQIMEAKP